MLIEGADAVEVLPETSESKEAAEMSKLTERVDAVEMLVENAESAEAKEELRPKLATLREQIKDLTEGYETRMQEVQERNKQFFQELKFLQNRMNRRDERLSQEAPDRKENHPAAHDAKADVLTGEGKKSKGKSKKTAAKLDAEASSRTKPTRDEPKKKKSKDQKRGKENARSVAKQAKPVQLRDLDYAPEVAPRAFGHTGWLAQAVPHVVPEKPDPAMISSALAPWIGTAMWNAHHVAAAFPTAPLAPSPVQPSPFVPGPTPSPLYDGQMSIAGGLLHKPTVGPTEVNL
jgi:hypothetical protein